MTRDLGKSQNIRVFRTEISDRFYKEIPTEIDHVSKFLAISGSFEQNKKNNRNPSIPGNPTKSITF